MSFRQDEQDEIRSNAIEPPKYKINFLRIFVFLLPIVLAFAAIWAFLELDLEQAELQVELVISEIEHAELLKKAMEFDRMTPSLIPELIRDLSDQKPGFPPSRE